MFLKTRRSARKERGSEKADLVEYYSKIDSLLLMRFPRRQVSHIAFIPGI